MTTASLLTPARMNDIRQHLITVYENGLNTISQLHGQDNVGGQIRQAMGELVEKLVGEAWISVARLYIPTAPYPRQGKDDKIRCANQHNHYYHVQVDRHCYINDRFVLAVEAKSYLDSCYLARASSDFRLLKTYCDQKPLCIVVSIEDAAAKMAAQFICDDGWVDRIFILADGKRTSARPIWNPAYRKALNNGKVDALIQYIDSVISSNI